MQVVHSLYGNPYWTQKEGPWQLLYEDQVWLLWAFGLEALATWTEPPLLTLLWIKKSFQIPKAGGPSGTAGRRSYSCTFHPLFQPVFPAIPLAHREQMHSFLPAFCGFSLKWRDTRNYSSSLTKMYFVTDTINICNKGMLLISWLQLTRRDEHYMVPYITTCKISVLWLHSIQLEVVSLAPCLHTTLAFQTRYFGTLWSTLEGRLVWLSCFLFLPLKKTHNNN